MPGLFSWPEHRRCAVSLTYDDGLPVHYTLVGPLLEQHGFRCTFYPTVQSDLSEHPEHWRALASRGHELGNHSLFHPCRRVPPEQYAWLEEDYDLCSYSPSRLRSELATANFVLQLIDGNTQRTYGNTCCHTTLGCGDNEQSMDVILAELFVAARGALTNRMAHPSRELNLLNVGCIGADGRSFSELTGIVGEAQATGGWAVLMMHGVGADTHSMNLDPAVHARFISWLAQQPDIWVAPFITVANHINRTLREPAAEPHQS